MDVWFERNKFEWSGDNIQMEIRDINEIRSAIKYMDYKPVMLAKFYDIKSLLFKEILENEDYYKVAYFFIFTSI